MKSEKSETMKELLAKAEKVEFVRSEKSGRIVPATRALAMRVVRNQGGYTEVKNLTAEEMKQHGLAPAKATAKK